MSDTLVRIGIAVGIIVVFVWLSEKFVSARKKGRDDAGPKSP